MLETGQRRLNCLWRPKGLVIEILNVFRFLERLQINWATTVPRNFIKKIYVHRWFSVFEHNAFKKIGKVMVKNLGNLFCLSSQDLFHCRGEIRHFHKIRNSKVVLVRSFSVLTRVPVVTFCKAVTWSHLSPCRHVADIIFVTRQRKLQSLKK